MSFLKIYPLPLQILSQTLAFIALNKIIPKISGPFWGILALNMYLLTCGTMIKMKWFFSTSNYNILYLNMLVICRKILNESDHIKFLLFFIPIFVVFDLVGGFHFSTKKSMSIWRNNHRILKLPYWTSTSKKYNSSFQEI